MSLETYAELKSAVLDRIDRSDMTVEVEHWVSIAEEVLRDDLRVDWLEVRAYATPTSAFISVPVDFNGLRNLEWDLSGYRYSLEQVTPDLIDRLCPSTEVGTPQWFTTHDEQFELRPAPASDNETQAIITYYLRPTPLSDENTTNEFLANCPTLLFYRAVAEGFSHFLNSTEEAKYLAHYERERKRVVMGSSRRKWGEMPLRAITSSAV